MTYILNRQSTSYKAALICTYRVALIRVNGKGSAVDHKGLLYIFNE